MRAFFFCKNIVTYKDEHLLKAQSEYQITINKLRTFKMSRNLFASEKYTLMTLS